MSSSPALPKRSRASSSSGRRQTESRRARASRADLREAGLGAAVERAFRIAKAGDTVLFSPMCSSFDMFENYKARGNAFKQAVEAL